MKIHLTQTLDCEFEIPKEFENNIQEYINKNIYTPMIAMWDINDMTTPFYDGYMECPTWNVVDETFDII